MSCMMNTATLKRKRRKGVGGLEPPPAEAEGEHSNGTRRVIFILEHAQLQTARLGTQLHLLNADDHKGYLAKNGKEISDFRPDIIHQSLLAILDSPLSKMGYVSEIYLHTRSNVVIKVDPTTKLPRTYGRFAGLMTQLLQKFGIRSENRRGKLLQCVKGPVTQHLPGDSHIIALSREGSTKKRTKALVHDLNDGRPIVFVIGAFPHGHLDINYAECTVSITELSLSAACCVSKLTHALEDIWDIA